MCCGPLITQVLEKSLSDPLSVEPFIQISAPRRAWNRATQSNPFIPKYGWLCHTEVVSTRSCRWIPQCHSLWPLECRLHSPTLLIHVIQIVKTTKMILIMSYWKLLPSLSPLDVGKPAVRPHNFSIYIREAASEKQNDLYVFFPPKSTVQPEECWVGWRQKNL